MSCDWGDVIDSEDDRVEMFALLKYKLLYVQRANGPGRLDRVDLDLKEVANITSEGELDKWIAEHVYKKKGKWESTAEQAAYYSSRVEVEHSIACARVREIIRRNKLTKLQIYRLMLLANDVRFLRLVGCNWNKLLSVLSTISFENCGDLQTRLGADVDCKHYWARKLGYFLIGGDCNGCTALSSA